MLLIRAATPVLDKSGLDIAIMLISDAWSFRKKEIPYKRACEGHRVHGGYTILSLNPIPGVS